MKRFLLLAVMILFIQGCSTTQSLKEIDDSKPPVFSTKIEKTPEECGSMPPIPVNIAMDGFYTDMKGGSYSNIDMTMFNAWKESLKSIEQWNLALNKLSDDYLLNGNKFSGKCVIQFLDDWARANALLGEIKAMPHEPKQSRYQQKWLFITSTVLYFKTKDVATPEQSERIKWWLTRVSKDVKYNSVTEHNNHYAWTAVGILQLGIITGNKEDIDYGRKAFNHFTDSVRSDGYLRTEIWRGKRTLFYHNFTLQALCYMAQLSTLIGEDWWQNKDLQKLINTTFNGTIDVKLAGAAANTSQEGFRPDEWGWYGMLPDGDARKETMKEFVKTVPVAWKDGKQFYLTKIPNSKELGGDQDLLRKYVDRMK